VELPARFTNTALFVAVLALVPGCGGVTSRNLTPIAMSPSATVAQNVKQPRSWMLPEAKREDLLYVTSTSFDSGAVDVFSYPRGKQVGAIVLGGEPMGACADRAGNVWITRFRMASAVEYAHGGTTQIGSVNIYPNTPWGCAVDPTTGNLAVTNTEGSVYVFPNSQGEPGVYTVQGDGWGFTFCTYDDSGDLFAAAPYSNIAELPKGGNEMTNLQLDFSINPWSIQWDERDKYLAVAGAKPKGEPTTIYHVNVSGTTGSLVGTTLLRGSTKSYPPQYWIEGDKILGPKGNLVESWRYPAGGRSRRFAHLSKDDHAGIYGIVVSRAR